MREQRRRDKNVWGGPRRTSRLDVTAGESGRRTDRCTGNPVSNNRSALWFCWGSGWHSWKECDDDDDDDDFSLCSVSTETGAVMKRVCILQTFTLVLVPVMSFTSDWKTSSNRLWLTHGASVLFQTNMEGSSSRVCSLLVNFTAKSWKRAAFQNDFCCNIYTVYCEVHILIWHIEKATCVAEEEACEQCCL